MNLAEGATSEALQQQCSFLSDICNHAADSPDNAAGGKESWPSVRKHEMVMQCPGKMMQEQARL